ncbi:MULTISPECIES: TetR/AcrR family transcriptional regulator [unclassified Microbacterium]|uniref:TetR/AcrR family transcriptional regulator n=1 Tax=unclassified Microbacterium TaxID=2609290 RepID=UPI000EA90814|nr:MULTISPECIES: TetR/AcrR family transcriptional regulator [unclassified Microbacterium]MBT2483539.1 TetR/AcrR family transcriptional regulator [Microbacterium sp. ISL-108]RKN66552.1 TetR/AcrR family transcriptional regulator [Microbacterium sp. CGR2]
MADQARPESSSARKHRAILDTAEVQFLRDGYTGVSMDELAEKSGVSKQTVYNHFGSKDRLFVELVTSMTTGAGDTLAALGNPPAVPSELAPYFTRYAEEQLRAVLTPRLMQLRRLVIGEVGRFPQLAAALSENGPERSIRTLTALISGLADNGLLVAPHPELAARTFNWLVLAAAINEAMLLGDGAIPTASAQSHHAAEAVRVFLAAYGSVN